MKHLAIRLVVSLLTFAIGIACAALLSPFRSNTVSNSQDEQAILQVERQYIQANLNADTDTLEKILADDFIITTRWSVENKEERLALLESPDFAFEAISTDHVRVKVNGERAVLTGKASIESRRGDLAVRCSAYAFTRIYEKRQGRWQIVSVRCGK
jgi:ketosteroid isomerase-like protein